MLRLRSQWSRARIRGTGFYPSSAHSVHSASEPVPRIRARTTDHGPRLGVHNASRGPEPVPRMVQKFFENTYVAGRESTQKVEVRKRLFN